MSNFTKRLNSWAGKTGKKGPGYCAICGDFGNLTRDHVPPKGCVEISNSILSRLTMDVDGGTLASNSTYIQGGLRFKTLCGLCNNDYLGLRYDPELKYFVDGMRRALQNVSLNVVLPRPVQAEANLHLVAKSVIGHVLAAHSVPETESSTRHVGATESLRQYFLNPDMSFPEDWRLYCWPYISRRQIILRHAVWMDVSLNAPSEKIVYGHVLKFLPFGFWLVYRKHAEFQIDAQDITPTESSRTRREIVRFDLRKRYLLNYPECPTGYHVLLYGDEQSSVSAPAMPTTPARK